ncbi:MAG: hypothetical protein ACKOQW_07650 [Phycisphaerales bacterium]
MRDEPPELAPPDSEPVPSDAPPAPPPPPLPPRAFPEPLRALAPCPCWPEASWLSGVASSISGRFDPWPAHAMSAFACASSTPVAFISVSGSAPPRRNFSLPLRDMGDCRETAVRYCDQPASSRPSGLSSGNDRGPSSSFGSSRPFRFQSSPRRYFGQQPATSSTSARLRNGRLRGRYPIERLV